MKAFLENTDLYAFKINFNYREKNVFHSFIGISLSIATYIVMIYFINYFSRDFINKQNPRVTYKETEFDNTFNITLDKIIDKFYVDTTFESPFDDKFDAIFSSKNSTAYEILTSFAIPTIYVKNDTYITLKNPKLRIAYDNRPQDCLSQRYKLKGINCTTITVVYEYNISNQVDGIFQNLTLTTFKGAENKIPLNKYNFEINSNEQIRINLDVDFGGEFFQKFDIRTFNKMFELNDYIININNLGFFKKYKYNQLFSKYNMEYSRELKYWEIEYQFVKVENDAGFIFSEISDQFSPQIKSKIETGTNFDQGYVTLVLFSFNKVMKRYDRIYKKLQNVFADLGGLLNLFILIGNILTVQFNKRKFDYDMVNLLYKSDVIEKAEFSKNENRVEIINLLKLSSNRVNNNVDNTDNQLGKELNNMDNTDNPFGKELNDIKKRKNDGNDSKRSNCIFLENSNNKKQVKINVELKDDKGNNAISQSSKEFQRKQNIKKDEFNATSRNLCTDLNYSNTKNLEDSHLNKNRKKINNLTRKNEKDLNQKIINEPKNASNYKDFEDIEFNKAENFVENYNKIQRSKLIKLSKIEFLQTFFLCRKFKNENLIKKEKLFFEAEKKIYGYLDVINYAMLFEDFEKLKALLLNEHQITAFDFIPNKPKKNELGKQGFLLNVLKSAKYLNSNIKRESENSIDSKMIPQFYKSYKDFYENL